MSDLVYRPELSLSEVSWLITLCQQELKERLDVSDLFTDYDLEQNSKTISELKSLIAKLENFRLSEGGAEQ